MDDEFADPEPEPLVAGLPTAEPFRALTLRSAGEVAAPIIVDLGRCSRKRIKELKRGEGPLAAEVAGVVERVRTELAGEELAGKTLLPLVVIYGRKRKRRRPAPTLTLPFNNQS